MKWITREHVKVDRVACPWLITKYIDLRILVDGALMLRTDDTRLRSAGEIGLFANRAQILVRASRVIAL